MATNKKVTICPTVTARSSDEYREQMERLAPFVRRIHIDVADGVFTPVKLSSLKSVWWPHGVTADLHVMFQRPFGHTADYLRLAPQLVIVHAEAEGQFLPFSSRMRANSIRVGVALKPHTSVEKIKQALDWIDHVLIFSGNLGHFGGQANTHLLTKALHMRRLKPELEIGWDGGINIQNANLLAAGGVNVLNVGGFIQHAHNPRAAYEQLRGAVGLK
ncbi:MAG: ribulose-phosphate 3-epimerase [Candidatus Saccharimonadales bacterium]